MIADLSELPERPALGGMFRRWQEELLNSFTFRVTPGGVAGRTNRAKGSERPASGSRNFANVRRRLLLAG
jgi:transposase